MKISYDVDDLSPYCHRFDLIENLRERYLDFKMTAFFIPWDIRYNAQEKGTPITDKRYKDFADYVVDGQLDGWLDISIHGLTHAPEEFLNLTYTEAQNRLLVAQKMLTNVGIKYNDMFKAPQWLINKDAKKAVEDMGMKVMEDGYYNWNTKDEMPKKKRKIIAHGHVQDVMGNGIEESFTRLMKIPDTAKWVFLRDI